MTIVEAIKQVLLEEGKPLTHKQIYALIVNKDYYEFGAKDPVSVVRAKLRKHCHGLNFASASPKKVFALAGKSRGKLPLYEIWDKSTSTSDLIKIDKTEAIPEEIIELNHREHMSLIKSQLLEQINTSDPAFFEQLVVELLLRMGYGWDQKLAGKVTGGSGDEGIDGIISEDKLGLENIYIQAKRYKNKVPPSEIRDFIGAMAIRGARKGVFFASSDFSVQAKDSAIKAQNMNITLINGEQLSDYLVQHEMGIAAVSEYKVYEIDKNFFDY